MKILIAGDFCQKNRVNDFFKERKYSELFKEVKPILNDVDYSIVNFEFPIISSECKANPIKKSGPNLKGTIEAVEAIQYLGFNCCTLANNHILDQGIECCLDTRDLLERAKIDTVGVGANLEESERILYKNIAGHVISIINCCEHEFSVATSDTAGANPLNPIRQFRQIQEAKRNSDYVFVIVHGGLEHFQLPSPTMQETYRFFIDAGADVVVNGHQHCFSGYEIYKNKPIFYGLGNFCFDYPDRYNMPWNEGYMVELIIEDNSDVRFNLIPYVQCNNRVGIKILEDTNIFQANLARLNNIIVSRQELDKNLNQYYLKEFKKCLCTFQPYYNNRVLSWLYRRNLLPTLMSKRQILRITNFIECESQRDKIVHCLKLGKI